MQVRISLPDPGKVDGVEEVKSFLKQLELSVHHAQKSLQEMVSMQKESGNLEPSMNCLYRLGYVEDSSTGERFDSENPYSDRIELELYSD